MRQITAALLTEYLSRKIPGWQNLEVRNLSRLPLGASRETYRFDLDYQRNGVTTTEKLILRRDPPASHVETDRKHEFKSYQAIYGHGIPVPKMVLLEEDTAYFDGAVSVAEDMRGFHNSEYQLQTAEWRDRVPRVAEQMWTYMGKLAAIDTTLLKLESFMRPATVSTAAAQELDYWEDTLDRNPVAPECVVRAAIRSLRRNPPVAQKLAMVHGDFRAGNFLYDDKDDLKAVLDWEMAHIGDPLEDLGWSIIKTFNFGKDDRRSGLATKEQAVAFWENASGLKADPDALRWWELFNCVKAQALWAAAAAIWSRGENRDVIMAYAPWWLRNAQDKAALDVMGRL